MGLGRIFSGCDSVEDEWGEKIALVCVHACVCVRLCVCTLVCYVPPCELHVHTENRGKSRVSPLLIFALFFIQDFLLNLKLINCARLSEQKVRRIPSPSMVVSGSLLPLAIILVLGIPS